MGALDRRGGRLDRRRRPADHPVRRGPLLAAQQGLITPFPTWLEVEHEDGAFAGELFAATLAGQPIDLAPARARAAPEQLPVSFCLLLELSERRRTELFQTELDLRSMVMRPEAKHLLTIDAWCHPDVYGGPPPSNSEAFRLVAEVLVTGDVSRWAPTEKPNNRDYRAWLARG